MLFGIWTDCVKKKEIRIIINFDCKRLKNKRNGEDVNDIPKFMMLMILVGAWLPKKKKNMNF